MNTIKRLILARCPVGAPHKKALSALRAKCLILLAPRAGLEPATGWLTAGWDCGMLITLI